MPHNRRGNYYRNNRRGDQPETNGPQGNAAPPENRPPEEAASGSEDRPQRSGHRGMFPREITPSEVNERLNQRKPANQGNAPANDGTAGQANAPHQRRGGQQRQSPAQGNQGQRRNPANRNNPNRNPRDNRARRTDSAGQDNAAGNAVAGNAGARNAGARNDDGNNVAARNGGANNAAGNDKTTRSGNTRGGNARGNAARGNAPHGNITRGGNARGVKTGSAPRQGFYVQRSRNTDRPAPSTPIRTNKGIKARNQRGQFSQHWWARRWIEAMEGLVDQARLQRGRSYARSGQVLSIVETQNGIEAKVQGSRPKPYEVTIQVTPLNDRQWDLVIDAMSEQALFTAQLLAGEMPGNIEDAFRTAGVSLFPSQTGDLSSDCTCPDWANPCKHVAATHYILGDRFDDDPFLLFRMRGRTQEEILEALRQRRAEAGPAEAVQDEPLVETEKVAPLEALMDRFWEPVESLDDLPLTIKLASIDLPLLKRMGEPAFMGGESLQALLKPFYDTFTRSALRAAYSEEEPVESSNGQEELE